MGPDSARALTESEAAARRTLGRYRAVAAGLLLLMALLVLGSFALAPGYGRDLLLAAAKAGLIGGLADWFAVTALFRRPLGLPIPHTAIIPRQKERLGAALGRFVANYVIAAPEVARLLERIDLADILRRFLADPAAIRPAAQGLAKLTPRLLRALEDGRARRLVGRLFPRLAGGAAAGQVVAGALRVLVAGDRHHDVLAFVLTALRDQLAAREDSLRQAIEERVREQGGRLVGWAVGASVARRIMVLVQAELERLGPGSVELREAFDEWVRREIDRLEHDPDRAAEMRRLLRDVVAHPAVQAWLWDVWARLRVAIEDDAGRAESRTVTVIEQSLGGLGALLATDSAARDRVRRGAETIVGRLLPAAQANLATFIADVVARWDTATITERLELRVGKDLQFVRLNGTLVGFLAGGALFAALRALFGTGGF